MPFAQASRGREAKLAGFGNGTTLCIQQRALSLDVTQTHPPPRDTARHNVPELLKGAGEQS